MTSETRFGEEDEGRQHPEELRRDLNPASLNLERLDRTAYDLQPSLSAIADLPDDILKRIPIVSEGSRLKQGATYLDLRSRDGEFTAAGNMVAEPGSVLTPKSAVDHEAWNLLLERLTVI